MGMTTMEAMTAMESFVDTAKELASTPAKLSSKLGISFLMMSGSTVITDTPSPRSSRTNPVPTNRPMDIV